MSGSHGLRIETGRYDKLPVEDRRCLLCAEAVEDELHYLVRCPRLESIRTTMNHKIYQCCVTTLGGRQVYSIDCTINDQGVIVHPDGAVVIDWRSLTTDLERMKFILTAGYSIRMSSQQVQQRIGRILLNFLYQLKVERLRVLDLRQVPLFVQNNNCNSRLSYTSV